MILRGQKKHYIFFLRIKWLLIHKKNFSLFVQGWFMSCLVEMVPIVILNFVNIFSLFRYLDPSFKQT